MNLFEWKQSNTESIREELKQQIRDGAVVESHFLFSEEDLKEVHDEVLIEDFSEDISFEGEIDLDIDLSISSILLKK